MFGKVFRKRSNVDLEERAIDRSFFEDLGQLMGEHLGLADKAYVRKYIAEHFKGRGIPSESYRFVCEKGAAGFLEDLGYKTNNNDGRIDKWKRLEKTVYENQIGDYLAFKGGEIEREDLDF